MADPSNLPGICPTGPTGAMNLQQAGYIGQGITVAILDTGCDIATEGLKLTPDGKPKFVDTVDATGSGDVDMSVTLKLEDERVLKLPSGRSITVPEEWNSANGEFSHGVLHLSNVIPKPATNRLVKERAKDFNEIQRQMEADLRGELCQAQEELKTLEEAKKKDPSNFDMSALRAQTLEVKNLENSMAQLVAFGGRADIGEVYDCLMWNAGDEWIGCVLTNEDVTQCKPMGDYAKRCEYDVFSQESLANYALKLFPEENVLSVVCHGGSHGTHVAGIVGAFYGEGSELNGVAPGCQFVNVRIGCGRLGTMETTKALIRACRVIIDNKCDLVNLSYGEVCRMPDSGRIDELYHTLVEKYGVIYCSSAGNSGPNLGSVGAPGGTNSDLISIGALVTPEIVDDCLGKTDNVRRIQNFTWSSRGPSWNGARGVDLVAPGGAIQAVPQSTLTKNNYMNGTSMASPNACGCIALLLSALQDKGLMYTPSSVRRALENSAVQINLDGLSAGCGMINVDRALKYCIEQEKHQSTYNMPFAVAVGDKQGILVSHDRDFEHDTKEFSVNVKPRFHEDLPNEMKVEFNLNCDLRPTASWVQTPDFMLINGDRRSFATTLQLNQLSPGYHYAEIHGFDRENPAAGPMFRVPVTVMRPENGERLTKKYRCDEGVIHRTFVNPPPGATVARVEFEILDEFSGSRIFCADVMQHRHVETKQLSGPYWRGTSKSKYTMTVDCTPGKTFEVSVGQYCLSFPFGTNIQQTITFTGLDVAPNHIFFDGNAHASEFQVKSNLGREKFEPSVSLDTWRSYVGPSKAEITRLKNRDVDIQNLQINQLILEYTFDTAVSADVTPMFPLVDELLYEAQITTSWILMDSNKKYICTGDNWDLHKTKLNKQKGYMLRMQLLSNDVKELEKFKKMRMCLDTKLAKPVSLTIYNNIRDVGLQNGPVTTLRMQRGQTQDLFFGSPDDSKFPSYFNPGDVLSGQFLYEKSRKATGTYRRVKENPGGAGELCAFGRVSYTVPCKVPAEKKDDDLKEEDVLVKFISSVIKVVKDAGDKEKQRAAYERFIPGLMEQVEHDSLSALRMHKLFLEIQEDDAHTEKFMESGIILDKIDQNSLAAYFGINQEDEFADLEARRRAAHMKEVKSILKDALKSRMEAVIALEESADVVEEVQTLCRHWMEKDSDCLKDIEKREARKNNHLGTLLKIASEKLNPAGEKKDAKPAPKKSDYKEVSDLLSELGWKHIEERFQNETTMDFPQSYRRF